MSESVRHLESVFNLAFRMLRNRNEASEVTRRVFLRGYDTGGGDAAGLRNRLYRLTVQECIARLENEKRVTCESPEVVECALLRLRPESRAVVLLKHLCGCSYGQIGRILRMQERTVKRRLFDARRRLLEEGLIEPKKLVTTRASGSR